MKQHGGFEEFDPSQYSRSTSPRVTIRSTGLFGLNAAAFRALGEPEAVVLMYHSNGKIGMRSAKMSETNAYKVRKQDRAKSYMVSGSAFLNHYKIRYDASERTLPSATSLTFPATIDQGILIIDATAGSPVGRTPRKRTDAKRDEGLARK